MRGDTRANGQSGINDALVRRFRAPLMAYFLRRLRNYSDAEDLTQETFARLAAHPDRDDGEKISSYIFTIAANLLRDRARMHAVRRAHGHDGSGIVETISQPVEDFDPERVLLGREALRDVAKALAELSPQARAIFVLSRLEKVPQRDIAAFYGISVSAVEKHIIRATAFIGARLKRS
jgi:RNA polymerase sigma factor (sigma-70 family)